MSLNSFKRALWVFHLNTGSCNGCDIEILAALTPRYDVEPVSYTHLTLPTSDLV